MEVIPGFDGCPAAWLDVFDRRSAVPDRYDLPTPEGIVHVLITAPVKTVLQEIKRMPGRRVAGTRGEAFITNPFAALGEDASKVIDAEQFERARADAGLCFERFTARIRRDAFGYPVEIGLQVETWRGADIPDRTDVVQFDCDEDLARFIDRAQAKLDAGFQLCAWDDYEFEMTGDTQGQIDDIRSALRQRVQLRILVRYADVYDLSAYSGRIEDVGEEKPYYSPYIAKRNADESWFPENLVPVVVWRPDGKSEPVAVPLHDTLRETLKTRAEDARAAGRDHIELPGFARPMPVTEAEHIIQGSTRP